MTTRPTFVMLLALLVAWLLVGCNEESRDKDESIQNAVVIASPGKFNVALSLQEQRAAGIQVQPAIETEVAEIISLNGTLQADQERIANVLPLVPGRLVASSVPLGATVKAGETLAVIESIDLGEAQATNRQNRSEAALTESALARAQKLAAEDIIAQKDFERARDDAERARAAHRASTDKLRLLGVTPAPLNANQDAIYPVVSPLSGTVIDKHAVPGSLVGTEPLYTVADLTTVWLEADVFEKDLAQLIIGSTATVAVAAYPERKFEGRLTYVSPTMDAISRTVKARIEVPNVDGVLKPGMFASALLSSAEAPRALLLPAAAVTLFNNKPTVFVLTSRGFEPRSVEMTTRANGSVEIHHGLQPGENIAVSGAYTLKSRLLKSSLADDD